MKQKLEISNLKQEFGKLIDDIKNIMDDARAASSRALNQSILFANWHRGRRIVEELQDGNSRARYGENLISTISKVLTIELGKGYSERSIRNYRQFYLDFPDFEIWHARVPNLSWTHYKILLRVDDKKAREWYLTEASNQMWSSRTLDRNVSSQYYFRLLSSKGKGREEVIEEMKEKTSGEEYKNITPEEFIKSPVVTEFLGLSKDKSYTERTLESALLDHLQEFLLELGKGYAFVERQQHIVTDTDDYYIDLVFYNYLMKCFVLIDLKTTKLTHQDVGQMDMYVRMYDELKRPEGDNPTIGIVLCSETSKDIARFSVLNGNKQLFASTYLTYLPSEAELLREIDIQKEFYLLQHPEAR
ncbi:MAG: DUF1016 domain-containing protein [Bacteroidales bacterium]|nr:DUF1016 domain-containing protein [Bacteroidales bacterium]